MKPIKEGATFALVLAAIPLVAVLGAFVFRERFYSWLSLCVAVFSCIPLFYSFERKETRSEELTVIAVLVALSAAGRFVFAWIPAFKPITAITVIVAVWLGKEAGFAVGSLSAVISNFYFGQGPWTPFQMLSWGLIGFFAGLLSRPLKKSKILLCIYGALAGVFYSLALDIWTTVWAEGTFSLARYLSLALAALPTTASYSVSNVIFLLLLAEPIGFKLARIKKKFGLFMKEV
ncbi:MAG: ECF transporter S component [Clostridia bacterium]|nr:ECF transporter S component [Clostridia bacterium]